MRHLLVAFCALAVSGCAVAPQMDAFRLAVVGDRLFVPVRINGVETEALLDSAAEATLIDASFARRIGLATGGVDLAKGTGGEQDVTFAQGLNIEAVGLDLTGVTAAVLDLSDISARLIGKPLTVVLGRELFDAARLEIDIADGTISAVSPADAPAGVELPLKSMRGLETIPIRIEGHEADATFDLGNGSEMLIGAAFAAQAGLDAPDRITGARTGGGVGGEVTRKLVRLREIEVGGARFADVEAGIDETETAEAANVGVRILKNFRITVDYADRRLWLQPLSDD